MELDLYTGRLSCHIKSVIGRTFNDIEGQAMDNGDKADLQAFLTTEEVLSYLKTTPRTIYRLIRDGELPAVRIGRQWRFKKTDLEEWVERQGTFSSAHSAH